MRHGSETRARIRRQALTRSIARGVDAVSVRDVATAAGCPPPGLCPRWRPAAARIEELFAEGYTAYDRALAAAVALPFPLPARLEAMVRRICALHAEDRTTSEFLLRSRHRSLPFPALPVAADANPITLPHRPVGAAMAAGELPPGDPALLGVVVQAATSAHCGRSARGLDAMAAESVALCQRLIAADPVGARR
jgi:AcrR family transcriptional regulator